MTGDLVRALRGHLLGDTDDTKSEASDIRAILKARKVRCYRFERNRREWAMDKCLGSCLIAGALVHWTIIITVFA